MYLSLLPLSALGNFSLIVLYNSKACCVLPITLLNDAARNKYSAEANSSSVKLFPAFYSIQ